MRAMRNYLGILLLAIGAAACGDSSTAADMSMPHLDMTVGPDMAMRMPDGVKCGTTETCKVGQECCISFANNMATGASCIATGGSCSGAALACDGPEDCTTPSDTCCAQIDIGGGGDAGVMFAGGNSSCGACMPAFTGGTLTTRLCHATADCANFSINLGITVALDKCCSTSATANTQFCAPDPSVLAALGQTANYTCL